MIHDDKNKRCSCEVCLLMRRQIRALGPVPVTWMGVIFDVWFHPVKTLKEICDANRA